MENYRESIDTLKVVNEEGVFIEELKSLLKDKKVELPFIGLNKKDMEKSVTKLEERIIK